MLTKPPHTAPRWKDIERKYAQVLPRPVGQYLRTSSYLSTDVPLRIARDPRILDKVESILGPDILMWSCEYFIKVLLSFHLRVAPARSRE